MLFEGKMSVKIQIDHWGKQDFIIIQFELIRDGIIMRFLYNGTELKIKGSAINLD